MVMTHKAPRFAKGGMLGRSAGWRFRFAVLVMFRGVSTVHRRARDSVETP